MTRRRDPHSWITVRLSERDLAEVVLEVAAPLIDGLGPAPSIEEARGAIELAIAFWNASVRASKLWGRPRVKALNDLRRRMRGRRDSPGDDTTFERLTERWRDHWTDPRLVESWTYEADAAGVPRLVCATALPEGVKAEVPPPVEKRISIGGRFLDEVRIPLRGNARLAFPVERHHGVIGDDGTVTVHAMMPSVLQLFAEGLLPRVGSEPVEVVVGGRALGPLVLAELRCGEESSRHDVAILVFRPISASRGIPPPASR